MKQYDWYLVRIEGSNQTHLVTKSPDRLIGFTTYMNRSHVDKALNKNSMPALIRFVGQMTSQEAKDYANVVLDRG